MVYNFTADFDVVDVDIALRNVCGTSYAGREHEVEVGVGFLRMLHTSHHNGNVWAIIASIPESTAPLGKIKLAVDISPYAASQSGGHGDDWGMTGQKCAHSPDAGVFLAEVCAPM